MCRLCCRCELCSLKRRTINSTTPCVLASSLNFVSFPLIPSSIFGGAYLMLLHYLCSSLLLLFRFTHGEIGSVGSACGILSGPSSHSILSSVFTPCSFHNPDVRLSTLPHLWYVLILSHLTRHIPPLAFSSCCHPSLYPTEEGGKGEKKNTLLSPHHTIILHFRSLSNPISPSFTFYPPPPPPPAPHSFDLLE